MIKEKLKQWSDDRKRLADIERKKKEAYFDSLEEEAGTMGKIQAQIEKAHRAKEYSKKLENLREEKEIKRKKRLTELEKGSDKIDFFGVKKDNYNNKDSNEIDFFGIKKKDDFKQSKGELNDLFSRNI